MDFSREISFDESSPEAASAAMRGSLLLSRSSCISRPRTSSSIWVLALEVRTTVVISVLEPPVIEMEFAVQVRYEEDEAESGDSACNPEDPSQNLASVPVVPAEGWYALPHDHHCQNASKVKAKNKASQNAPPVDTSSDERGQHRNRNVARKCSQ